MIFLPAILIPACVSSSPAFLMMYSAQKLNKQGDNIWGLRDTTLDIVYCTVLTFQTQRLSQWGTAEGRIFTVPACLPTDIPLLIFSPSIHGLLKRSSGQGPRRKESLSLGEQEEEARELDTPQLPCPRKLEGGKQSMPSSPVGWGRGR